MAEVILTLVLRKLAEAAVRETLHLYGARSKLDSLQHELRWIGAFLKDAESKCDSNAMMKTWVNDVRDVAYRIEDVINTFMAEPAKRNRPGKFKIFRKVLMNPVKLSSLVSEMDEIQKRLCEIKECTDKYGIKRDEFGDSSNRNNVTQRSYPVIIPDEDDPDVIGLERDKENIVNLLIDPNKKKRHVVSIVGLGGLGKTTLARKAYNSNEVNKFFRLWLSISQQFTITNILKRILEKIRPLQQEEKDLLEKQDPDSQREAKEYFTKEVNESLKQKQYLIVMDDVWVGPHDLWDDVKVALPDVNNGSRVLITTRFVEVARRADPTCVPYELHCLNEDESKQLLLKKAFPDPAYATCPDELSDLPDKFAMKCGGLPLALVVVGGLLSRTSPTFEDWRKIFEKFSWHDQGDRCIRILATSYDELPIHLKPCFMYFGAFPEDSEIRAKSLIRIWVAEGFIPEKDNTTMEETAQDYLEELVQRSMIQISSRRYNRSIKYCRIHDLLRDLAIEKAKENRFLEIISNEIVEGRSSIPVRRAAIHHQSDYRITMKCALPRLTTLLYHGNYLDNEGGALPLLKVLMGGEAIGRLFIKKSHFKKSTQLRYIEINHGIELVNSRPCPIISHYLLDENIFRPLSLARNLQTLDIGWLGTSLSDSDCIWGINTLRHVIIRSEFYGPPSTAHLPNLQTLKWVTCRTSWVTEGWPSMPNIRVLKIAGLPANYGESFYIFLSGLHHLTSLQIPDNNEMIDMSKFSCCKHLQSLSVHGKWFATLGISFPEHLIKLKLRMSLLKEDPMPILEQLESLKVLVLEKDSYTGRQLSCSAGRFPLLQFLSLEFLRNLEEWKAEKGAMPMLKEIRLWMCRQLRLIPELRHMTSLTKLIVSKDSVAPELERLVQEESRNIREGTSHLTISGSYYKK